MAIYRLSLEVLQGERDGDDDTSHAAAVAGLRELEARIREEDGVITYPEDEKAPWGVPVRPDTLNLDFDTTKVEEAQTDEAALDVLKAFLLLRRS
jgi:hypothetical protein